jgi:hypothetical protein
MLISLSLQATDQAHHCNTGKNHHTLQIKLLEKKEKGFISDEALVLFQQLQHHQDDAYIIIRCDCSFLIISGSNLVQDDPEIICDFQQWHQSPLAQD